MPAIPDRRSVRILAIALLATLTASLTSPVIVASAEPGGDGAQKLADRVSKRLQLPADSLRSFTDASADPVAAATGLLVDAPHVDGTNVAYGVVPWKRRNLRALEKWQKADGTAVMVGAEVSDLVGGDALVIAFQTAEPFEPATTGGTLFYAGTDGARASSIYGGGLLDHFAGNESVTIGGYYPDQTDPLITGTYTGDYLPGGELDFHGLPPTSAGVVVGDTVVFVRPIGDQSRTASLSLQGSVDGQQVVDILTPPNGLSRLGLTGAPLVPDTFCYSLGIFPEVDADGSSSGYQVELALEGVSTWEDLHALVASWDEASALGGELVSGGHQGWELAPVGEAGTDAYPGTFQVFDEVDTAYANWVVPGGTVSVTGPSGSGSGAATLLEVSGLFGLAPIWLDGSFAGIAAGNPSCGRLDLGTELCVHVEKPVMAPIRDALESERTVGFVGTDGTHACALLPTGSDEPVGVVTVSGRASSELDWRRRVDADPCTEHRVAIGAAGALLECPNGSQTLFWYSPLTAGDSTLDWGLIYSMVFLPGTAPAYELSLTETATLTPYIHDALSALEADIEDDVLFGGVSLSVDF